MDRRRERSKGDLRGARQLRRRRPGLHGVSADHWAFDGAHLGYGDTLGAKARIFGYEVDGLDATFHDGLPFPTGVDGAASEIEILAMGAASNNQADHGVWGETLYIGDADAASIANALYGRDAAETRARAGRGNGVMIHWRRGAGEVFTAATVANG